MSVDTLAMSKTLQAAGFTQQQAEAIVRQLHPLPEADRIQRLEARVAELEKWIATAEAGAGAILRREPTT